MVWSGRVPGRGFRGRAGDPAGAPLPSIAPPLVARRRARPAASAGRRCRWLEVLGALALAAAGLVATGPVPLSAAASTGTTALGGAVALARTPDGHGYVLATSYGEALSFGEAPTGGTLSTALAQPIDGAVTSPTGGAWLVAADGGVFSLDGARFYGSMGGRPLNAPVVGIAPTPDGGGYWLVAADGGVFTFGNAPFYGSTGGHPLNAPVVGIAPTPDGGGYWLVAADGGVFTFGNAPFYGSTGGHPLNAPVVGIAPTPDGNGYWLAAADGGVVTFGNAPFYGSTGGHPLNAPVVGIAPTPDGGGYWLVAADGGVFTFGNAPFYGSGVGHVRWGSGDVASRPECAVPATAVTAGKVIVVSLACQALTAYQDGVPFLTTAVTTGRPALPTPPGQYAVLTKVSPFLMQSPWRYGSPYWYPATWVQYTLWFRSDGYAIHDAPWRSSYGPGTNLEGSHGCINVPMPQMASLYSWATVGTPVRVY